MQKNEILSILDNICLYIISASVLILPLFFLPVTTDVLELPKQALLTIVTLVLIILFGIRGILSGKVTFRRTPIDIGLAVLFIVVLISTFASTSRNTSILSGIPILALILLTFLVINMINDHKKERMLIASALISGGILALFTLLQFLKIYILPYPMAQLPEFSLSGSLLATGIVLTSLLPIGVVFSISHLRKNRSVSESYESQQAEEIWGGFFLGSTIIIAVGAAITLFQLVGLQRPLLLPQETGLRTALGPLGSNFQNALFGSGPGTYLFNFTQFKDPAINNTNLWSLRFSSSSSLFLEIISTLGVLGLISFIFLLFRVFSQFFKSSVRSSQTLGVVLSLVLIIVFSCFLPFSLVAMFFLFLFIALFAVRLANDKSSGIHDVTLSIVAFKKGLLSLEQEPTRDSSQNADILPHIMFGIYLVLSGFLFFNIYNFLRSDIIFQQGLIAAQENRAQDTYDLQDQAIKIYPNRDLYHQVFSRTNLAIANSIVTSATDSTGLTPQQRDNVVQLVEQSIQYGRNATSLTPQNVVNWENLANVYKSIIGFAQNADQFAIASNQQAVILDPNNPIIYLNLGGIYYQLGQYDIAIQRFSEAVRIKNDFANAYYNLGHAYEAKGGTDNFLTAIGFYQSVRSLVPAGSEDALRIESEIATLERRIPGREEATAATTPDLVTDQKPLEVSTPSGALPAQRPPVTVEGLENPPATESGQ